MYWLWGEGKEKKGGEKDARSRQSRTYLFVPLMVMQEPKFNGGSPTIKGG